MGRGVIVEIWEVNDGVLPRFSHGPVCMSLAGIPPGKSDASGGIGPKDIVTSTSGLSARCRPMRPIFPVEFQLYSMMQKCKKFLKRSTYLRRHSASVPGWGSIWQTDCFCCKQNFKRNRKIGKFRNYQNIYRPMSTRTDLQRSVYR